MNVSLDFSVVVKKRRPEHDDWIKFFIGPRGRVCVLLHAGPVVAGGIVVGTGRLAGVWPVRCKDGQRFHADGWCAADFLRVTLRHDHAR